MSLTIFGIQVLSLTKHWLEYDVVVTTGFVVDVMRFLPRLCISHLPNSHYVAM